MVDRRTVTTVLVCGGRDYDDYEKVRATLNALKPWRVIHGGARGADNLADRWAQYCGIACEVYEADWETHGKAAGPMRNQKMLDDGKPDLVVAFPGGRGTADMVRRAKKAGVPVQEVA